MQFEEKKNTDANGKKIKRKQTTLKTRKSIGKGGSDDDDDFKPIKAAALKRKAPESKAVNSNSKQRNDDDDEKKIPIAKRKTATAAKKLVVNKDDEDSEPPAPKRKIAGQKKLLVDDDEEEDDNLRPLTKKVVPKKTVKDESDSDSVEVIEKPTAKKKGPAKLSANSGSDEPAKTKGKASKRKRCDTSGKLSLFRIDYV